MQLKIYQEKAIPKLLEEAKKLLGYSDGGKLGIAKNRTLLRPPTLKL